MIPTIDDDAGYRDGPSAALAAGASVGMLWDDIIRVCDRCGAVVIDTDQHDLWHHANLHGGDVTIERTATP